jgi:hypothetical protein
VEGGHETEFEKDALDLRNKTWVWATTDSAETDYYQPDNYDLRQWGYVFWDSGRLDISGLLDMARDRRLGARAYMLRRRRALEPSEERWLQDMGLVGASWWLSEYQKMYDVEPHSLTSKEKYPSCVV